jgi:uncharacterized protein YprB with RNaseH-like and TPR domain
MPDRPPGLGTLETLRRIVRRIERSGPPRPAPSPIEAVVGGTVEETEHGPILTVRREYALDHRHGARGLGEAMSGPPELLGLLTRAGPLAGDARRLLFLDTETTGLAGGTGTYAFLVGAGFADGDRFVVQQFFMRDLDEEPALLAALSPLVGRADGLVTYNGSGFDLPLLETRFVLARRRWPERWHLDLLVPARRVWGGRFPDCRLTTIESGALGLSREADVPGAMIPALYFDYLRRRHPGALPAVFVHNRHDVLSLVAMTAWLTRALGAPDECGLVPEEYAGLGRLWERSDPERSLACYRRALAEGLSGPEGQRVRLRLAGWEKRRARWEAARTLWEDAAGAAAFDPRPWEELAKFHEHRSRDLRAAHAVVVDAIERAREAVVPERVRRDFDHRLARIERRLAASGKGG